MFAHIDADAFFASVLQRKYPKLRNTPLLALGMGGGCVIAASYEAKRKGVKTGMRLNDARKLVPEATAIPSDFPATYIATQELFTLLERYCGGEVERSSPDEGYMDLACRSSACRAPTKNWEHLAHSIQHDAHTLLDLPVSVGIAPTKTLAKMASKHNKPRGICVIEQEDIMDFLRKKPIDAISGIGHRLTPKMQDRGYHTAFDFARADRWIVEKTLGKIGLELQLEIRGIPVYKVVVEPDPPKSISRCRSFKRTNDTDFLYAQLVMHLQRCSTKLRRHGFECDRLGIWLYKVQSDEKLKPIGFEHSYRSRRMYAERTFGRHLAEETLLIPFVKNIFEELIHPPLILSSSQSSHPMYMQTGLILSDFRKHGGRQISLFEEQKRHQRIGSLQSALDRLRKQYGNESVRYGPTISAN
jgi:nucleotidyltransferase/DNA polymerase involved in DNA repair